jgi:hypothetical protein
LDGVRFRRNVFQLGYYVVSFFDGGRTRETEFHNPPFRKRFPLEGPKVRFCNQSAIDENAELRPFQDFSNVGGQTIAVEVKTDGLDFFGSDSYAHGPIKAQQDGTRNPVSGLALARRGENSTGQTRSIL